MIRSSVDSLNDIPYHSHKSLKCSNPDLTYYQSYSRSFIVYKDNTVTAHSLSIPVFAVKTVIIIMHFYLHLFYSTWTGINWFLKITDIMLVQTVLMYQRVGNNNTLNIDGVIYTFNVVAMVFCWRTIIHNIK